MPAEARARLLFVPLDEIANETPPGTVDPVDWLAVDQALEELAALDPDSARVVELRLFSGLSLDEIATAFGTSAATVGRQWRFARVWLARRLGMAPAAP